jgi:hypothetical protein
MNNQSKNIVPYLVIREIPGAYRNLAINFISKECESKKLDGLSLIWKEEVCDKTGNILPDLRMTLIEVVKDLVEKSGKRICLVFNTDDCEYVELDGKVNHSTEPPSMRIKLAGEWIPYRLGFNAGVGE